MPGNKNIIDPGMSITHRVLVYQQWRNQDAYKACQADDDRRTDIHTHPTTAGEFCQSGGPGNCLAEFRYADG